MVMVTMDQSHAFAATSNPYILEQERRFLTLVLTVNKIIRFI